MARATPLTVAQTPGNQLIESAVDLMRQGLHEQAQKRLNSLLKQFPSNARILALLGDTLQKLEQYTEASTHYQQARDAGLDNTEIRLNLAHCLNRLARVGNDQALADKDKAQQAFELMQLVLQKYPAHTRALHLASDAQRLMGNIPAARDLLNQALQTNPKELNLLLAISHLQPFRADSTIFQVIPKALEDSKILPKDRANLHAVLGKAWMDIDEDEKAFQNYAEANRVMDESLPPIKAELERFLTFTRHFYTKPLFDQLSPYGQQDCPQIIISGMSRSGKSLVESLFRGVSGVHLAGEEMVISRTQKEFFGPYGRDAATWLADQTPDTIALAAASYKQSLQALGHPDKLKITTVPGDIWNLGLVGLWAPNVPIIFSVRGLLDLGVTGFFQQYHNPESYRYSYSLHHMGRQIACFEKMMEHWAQVLPNPIYLVDYEALTANPTEVMNNLLSQLDLSRDTDYQDIIQANAGIEESISPIVSPDAAMPITTRFVGIGQRFRPYLDEMIKGYHTIVDEFPRREPPVTFPQALPKQLVNSVSDQPDPSALANFNWQIPGQVTVMDNGGLLLKDTQAKILLALNSFGIIAFDPSGALDVADDLRANPKLQLVPQAVLGAGAQIDYYACLGQEYSGTLEPLPTERQPKLIRDKTQVLVKMPVQSHALDTIDGLDALDWLILDERHDNLLILENGKKTLANTLLIQVGVTFQPIWQGQNSMDEICHWAANNGFRLYRMVGLKTQPAMEPRTDLLQPVRPSELYRGALLLIPDETRMAAMSDAERLKLAFILDTVYKVHDLSYTLLHQVGAALAETYLKTHGYFDRKRRGPSGSALAQMRAELESGHIHSRTRVIAQWGNQFPKDAQVRRITAEHTSWLGKHAEAIYSISQAINMAPEDIGIRLSAIEILLRAGLWWEAEYCARTLAERVPEELRVQLLAWQAIAAMPRPDQQIAITALDQLQQSVVDDKNAEITNANKLSQARLHSIAARLLAQAGNPDKAIKEHSTAMDQLGDTQGPIRAECLVRHAETLGQVGATDDRLKTLWQVCSTWPYSSLTVHAYRHLRFGLPQAQSEQLRSLGKLHTQIQEIWSGYKAENLKYSFGDYGLPYQGFEPLMLPGTRPAMHRLGIYQLEQYLPPNAHALDIGCNHGFLLVGLAPHLTQGMGFDISQSCVDVGNAVAEYMGYSHIQLSSKPFEQFASKKQFDLVIACAVHHWIGVPLTEFGAKLFGFCKPGGIVLLESQGTRQTDATEVDFIKKAKTMASAGFDVIRKGSLCDDGLNYREFWILRKPE